MPPRGKKKKTHEPIQVMDAADLPNPETLGLPEVGLQDLPDTPAPEEKKPKRGRGRPKGSKNKKKKEDAPTPGGGLPDLPDIGDVGDLTGNKVDLSALPDADVPQVETVIESMGLVTGLPPGAGPVVPEASPALFDTPAILEKIESVIDTLSSAMADEHLKLREEFGVNIRENGRKIVSVVDAVGSLTSLIRDEILPAIASLEEKIDQAPVESPPEEPDPIAPAPPVSSGCAQILDAIAKHPSLSGTSSPADVFVTNFVTKYGPKLSSGDTQEAVLGWFCEQGMVSEGLITFK